MMKKKNELHLSERDKKRLNHARKFITAHLSEKYTVKQIAAATGINRYTLTYGFKKMWGSSVHQYIIRLRMEKAKRLLLQTNKPFKEISGACGYKRIENFNHAFKKYYGITPSTQRN